MKEATGVEEQEQPAASLIPSGGPQHQEESKKLTRRRPCSDAPSSPSSSSSAFSSSSSASSSALSSSSSGSSSCSPFSSSSSPPSSPHAEAAVSVTGGGELQRLFSAFRSLVSLPACAFRHTLNVLQSVVQWITHFIEIVSWILFMPPPKPFDVSYERQYGAKHPAFFAGSAQEAFDTARQTDRLLAVYLHTSHPNAAAEAFCRETLKDDLVIDLLDNTCVFYAADASVSSSDGARLARAFFPSLSSSRLPAFLLLLPQTASAPSSAPSILSSLAHRPVNRQPVILATLRGESFVDTPGLIAILLQGQEKAEESREAKRQQIREREENRMLREEQEREFAEVMRLESIKREEQEKRRQKEEARRDRVAQKKEAAAVRRQKRRAHAERLRQEESSSMTAQPHQRTAICLRLPSGSRVSREFPSHTSLEDLYSWADCLAEFTQNEELHIPPRFHLVVPPRRILKRGPTTLQESGLYPNSAVLLVPSDDED